MRDYRATASDRSPGVFSSVLHQLRELLTPKRVGYSLAGAFVLAGTAAMAGGASHPQAPAAHLNSQSNSQNTDSSTTGSPANNDAAAKPAPPDTTAPSTPTTTHFSANSSADGSQAVHLDVNGQPVAVPSNGSVHHSQTNQDGSHTTIDANGNSTTNGGSSSQSSSSFNVNIHTDSSSSVDSGGSN